MEDLSLVQGSARKRRRLDQVVKEAVVQQARKFGRAPALGAWARCANGPTSTVFGWRDSQIADYSAKCWSSFNSCDVVAMVVDGARLGEPAKEYLLNAFWNCDSHVGVWGRPQATTFPLCV